MAIITVFYAQNSKEDAFLSLLKEKTGYQLVDDQALVARAAELSQYSPDRISKAFSTKTSLFNPFTHDKEKSLAYLQLAAAEFIQGDGLILAGYGAHLIKAQIAHVLKVCLVAEKPARIAFAREAGEKDPQKMLHKSDADRAAWVLSQRESNDPWQASLYDILLPMDKKGVEEAVALVVNQLGDSFLAPSDASRAAARDALVQARVQLALALEGHDLSVSVLNGAVHLTVEKNVVMLNRLKQELQDLVSPIEGVNRVDIGVGKDFYQADIYRKLDFQTPSKVLLVDDEREFVETLSERLLLRDISSAVVYDGESALETVQDDQPDVMILDLKMPGIDGMEVLRRVKASQPDIEVIILTGHGNESDREACMALGAFAYLQKPVDIDVLSETMKKANEKINLRKSGQQQA